MAAPSYNPSSRYNPSGYSPPSHYTPAFPPQPSLPTSYNAPIPPSYTSALAARMTLIPSANIPNIPAPSYRPSFTPPSSSFSLPAAAARPHIPTPPSISAPPSSISSHTSHVRGERFTPGVPPSLPSSWTAPLSQSPSLLPSLQHPPLPSSISHAPAITLPPSFENPYHINRSVGPSTVPQPLDPGSLRFPTSHPFISLPTPAFAMPAIMPPTLSGPAQWVSSFPSFQATLPSRRITSWAPPSMERTPSILSNALVPLPRNYSFSWQPQANFTFKTDARTQQAYRRKFEQNMNMAYQLDAPPERPFPTWQTLGISQFAFQIDQRTMMFVDPAVFINLFQRATSAQSVPDQTQLAHFMERTAQVESKAIVQNKTDQVILYFPEKSTASLGQDLAAIALHSVAKIGGIAIEGFLGLSEGFNRAYTIGKPRTSLAHLWRNEAVPAIHQKIDGLCSTNLTDKFDSRNDPWYEQLVHSVLANPFSAVNMENTAVKGAQLARHIPRLEFALGGATAPRAGETLTAGLTGQQLASMETIPAAQMSKLSQEANIAEEVRIVTSQTVIAESKNTGATGGFTGKKGFQLTNAEYQKIRNVDAIINDRKYTGHALDQMQNRGFTLSIVEETIRVGKPILEKQLQGRIQYFNSEHNISVVVEKETQKVITVFYGK